jgi:2-methylisocitrate lyase-like PEP mutase family enzyme
MTKIGTTSATPGSLTGAMSHGSILVAPGIYDGLSALIAESIGFRALYLSGASVAYTKLGRSDVGLVTLSEAVGTLAAVTDRVSVPVIVDADTGFGNAINVMRTVREFERAGAAAIQLEDQATPKRCGHLADKMLVPADEMVGKLKAALDARRNAATLLIARTDAIAVEGLDRALDRAERYRAAGADIIFVEAPRSRNELAAVTARFAGRVPLMANMVEGGNTPVLDAAELAELGYAIAIFPGALVRAFAHMARGFLGSLAEHGTTAPYHDRMLDFKGLNDLLGTPALLELGKQYDGLQFETASAKRK